MGTKNVSTVNTLIRHKANINLPARGSIKRTPLQRAAEVGSKEIVQILIDHGADVNAAAAQRGGRTALQLAAIGGYAAIVLKLLSHGADVDALSSKTEGRTALEGAAENGRLDTVQILLNAGAGSKPESQSQIANAIALANDKGQFHVSAFLEAHMRASRMKHVPQEIFNTDFGLDDDSDQTVIRANSQDDPDEEMLSNYQDFQDAVTLFGDEFIPSAQLFQPSMDFGD